MMGRPPSDPLIISYLTLRRLVGLIAVLLPPILLTSSWLSSRKLDIYVSSTTVVASKLPPSVSGYYYTGMRNFLVGSLCALGVFLVGYNGYDNIDRWATNLAGILAICVAFFPTTPSVKNPSSSQHAIGLVHIASASLLFILLAFMALRFAKTWPGDRPKTLLGRILAGLGFANAWPDGPGKARMRRKKRRNVAYRICALLILLSMGLALAGNYLPVSVKEMAPTLFWFETIAILAFGVSWFVKGRSLLPIRRQQIMRDTQGAEPVTELGVAQEIQRPGTRVGELTGGAGTPIDQAVAQRIGKGEPVRSVASELDISPQRVSEITAEAS